MTMRRGAWLFWVLVLPACHDDPPDPPRTADASVATGIPQAASGARLGMQAAPVPVDTAAVALAGSAAVRSTPPSTFVFDAGPRKVLCDNRAGAFPRLRFVPTAAGGGSPSGAEAWVGVRVYGVHPDALAGRLGLANGDLVVAVDDIALVSGAAAASAIERACSAPSVTIHLGARVGEDAGPLSLGWAVSPATPSP